MKPTHSNQMKGLMISTEDTSSEMENSGIEKVNKEPNALFEAWIKQADAMEVTWGYMKTAIKGEVIFTKNMFDCSSVVICSNYDQSSGTYAQRSLMHILGSSLQDKDSSDQIFNLIRMANESSGTPKCIIALGVNVQNEHFSTIENQVIAGKDKEECQPLKTLQRLCDTIIVEKTNGIAVRPDGSYALMRPQRHPHQG